MKTILLKTIACCIFLSGTAFSFVTKDELQAVSNTALTVQTDYAARKAELFQNQVKVSPDIATYRSIFIKAMSNLSTTNNSVQSLLANRNNTALDFTTNRTTLVGKINTAYQSAQDLSNICKDAINDLNYRMDKNSLTAICTYLDQTVIPELSTAVNTQ